MFTQPFVIQSIGSGIDEVGGMPVSLLIKVGGQQTPPSPIRLENLAPPNAGDTTLSG